MPILIVVNNPQEWPLTVDGVEVVSARSYLVEPRYTELDGAKVFNFCRSYRYQCVGYYVSLLAAARGHKPFPSIATVQDMKSPTIIRLVLPLLPALAASSPFQDGQSTGCLDNRLENYRRNCARIPSITGRPCR